MRASSNISTSLPMLLPSPNATAPRTPAYILVLILALPGTLAPQNPCTSEPLRLRTLAPQSPCDGTRHRPPLLQNGDGAPLRPAPDPNPNPNPNCRTAVQHPLMSPGYDKTSNPNPNPKPWNWICKRLGFSKCSKQRLTEGIRNAAVAFSYYIFL